ncbi:MAG: RluA family pseudouridine synthase [Christensenellales bacterium]|jgi:23S rRNA pseudouridine1911/1915/1917 synthase
MAEDIKKAKKEIKREVKILYEDNHLIFVEKPPNMPVQGDSSGDFDLLSAVKAYIKEKHGKPGEAYIGMVHRLDRPVGGAMVFCRTSKAAARVSQQIRLGNMDKIYLAVVQGLCEGGKTLKDYLKKDPKLNMVHICPESDEGAKYAELSYEAISSAESSEGALTLVKVRLVTGRSHQIRVQMKGAGLPLWGDSRYGGGKPGQQIALWSNEISLTHPTTKERINVLCPPPKINPWSLFVI